MNCNVCTKGYEAMAIRDSKGYYMGTMTSDGKPNCRLTKSFQYRDEVQSLLDGKNVVHQMSAENALCANGRPCFGLFEHDAGIFRHNIYFSGLDFSGQENYYYKSEAAFLAREGTCYIPEAYFGESKSLNAEDGKIFSYADLLEEVNGNEESCRWLFYNRLTWGIPNTDIEELDKIGLMMCGTCGAFVGIEELHHCPEKAKEGVEPIFHRLLTLDEMVKSLLPENAFIETMVEVLKKELEINGELSAEKMHQIVELYLATEASKRGLIDDLVMMGCGWTVQSLLVKAVSLYTGDPADLPIKLKWQSGENVVVFDDFVNNSDSGTYWSQICDPCAKKHNIPENILDRDSGGGICGVEGCDLEADHYIDFPNEETIIL